MRLLKLSPIAVISVALVAQAPVPQLQQLRTEEGVIDKLVKELKAKEALSKSETLIATELPAYNTSDLNTVLQSSNLYSEFVNAHLAAANAAFAAGEWEKRGVILKKALDIAKANQQNFEAGAQPTLDVWKKAEAEAKEFSLKSTPRIQEIKEHLEKAKVEAADREAQKKMSKTELNELRARLDKANQEADELAQLESAKKVHETNIQQAAKINEVVGGAKADLSKVIGIVQGYIEKNQGRIDEQKGEIDKFNAEQLKKKKKVTGNTNWVNAVIEETMKKLDKPDLQAGFANRLLVLDPGNQKAQKALDNILQGKAPFEAEKKPSKGKGKKAN